MTTAKARVGGRGGRGVGRGVRERGEEERKKWS